MLRRTGPGSPTSPERDEDVLPSRRRDHSPSKEKKSGGWCSRQSFTMLAVGLMAGYIVMPILLIEKNFPTLPDITSQQQAEDSPTQYAHGGRNLEGTSENLQRLMEDRDIMAHQSLPTSTTPYVMHTKTLADHHRKKILITGGAGFVGSHLVDKLMQQGHEVIVVDNFFTGQKKNIAHWLHHPNFR